MPADSAPTKPVTLGRRIAPDTGTHELFLRHKQGDQAASGALVRRFMPLTRALARRYDRSSEPFDDVLQVASLGLVKALDRFDPNLGYPFSAFAVPTILGEIRRYFRDTGWSVHVTRREQELALKVRKAQEHLTTECGRAPKVNQLADHLELDPEKVINALQAIQAYEAVSLDAPCPGATDDATTYGESIGEEDARYELVDLHATLGVVLRQIPARERVILRMRFIEDLTQTEIGARMGISQMQVSRLLRRSLQQLRTLTRDAQPAQAQSRRRGGLSHASESALVLGTATAA